MNKKQKNVDTASDIEPVTPGLPVPISIEQFHEDVAYLFLHQLRTLTWMTSESAEWSVMGMSGAELRGNLYKSDLNAIEAGLPYSKIEHSFFARCLDAIYRYGYFGIIDESEVEPMHYETLFTWVSCIVKDMTKSIVADEWDGFGAGVQGVAARIVDVIDLADARLILEEKVSFLGHVDENAPSLSVRQVALLAGMEEMSIRSAAGPKRANPLPTYVVDGRTSILIADAKKWLLSKGRYVQVTKKYGKGDIDLTKHRFTSLEDLVSSLSARLKLLTLKNPERQSIPKKIRGIFTGYESVKKELFKDLLSDLTFVGELAEALEFEPEIFSLRIREVIAKEELKSVENALRVLIK